MGRSDFPLAVRGALNETALDMKTKTMPKEFDDNFTIRRKTFLKSQTGTNLCKNTFDINAMVSETGISNKKQIGDKLALQETGGNIQDRATPTTATRKGENDKNIQDKSFYYKKYKNRKTGKVLDTKGNKNIFKTKTGNIVLISQDAIIRKNKLVKGTSKLLYFKPKTVSIQKNEFVQPAGLIANEKLQEYFIKNAIKRLKK
jgi:hypothetical protein